MPLQLGGAPPCERCGERVYYAEQKIYMMKYWHKKCFRCDGCQKVFTDTGMANVFDDGSLACNQCVRKLTAMNKEASNKEENIDRTDRKNCPRCGKTVYFAEEKITLGRKWHKACFCCADCKTSLDSRTMADHEGEVYCKSCHGRKYGPKGYGFAGGAATMLSMDKGQEQHNNGVGNGSGDAGEYKNQQDPECCPRCGKRVYFAEQVLALSRKWHKLCFKCGSCGKPVDSSSCADHEGELYCRACHGKQFGPKGYGYAGGAGTMLSMDTGKRNEITRENVPHTAEAYVAPKAERMSGMDMGDGDGGHSYSKYGSGDCCPRCDKIVYIAEKKQAAGHVYHISCFTCGACHKKLDSSILTEKEREIYCRSCYQRNFGPKGYGHGTGAGILQMN